jgi:hypothetical protein
MAPLARRRTRLTERTSRRYGMSTSPRNFTPEEFITKLKSDDLSAPLAFTGMVKEAEDDRHLLFAGGTNCDTWTAMPLDMIERIEFGDVVSCRDHTHPLVKLFIKEPASEEAKVFASLAKVQLSAQLRAASSGSQIPGPPPSPTLPHGMSGRLPRPSAPMRDVRDSLGGQLFSEGSSCLACWQFCNGLTKTPDFDDWLWCLNFCMPLC